MLLEAVEALVAPFATHDPGDVAPDAPAALARLWRAASALLRFAENNTGRSISCGRRCSACCRGEILVGPHEAREIAKRLTTSQACAVRTAPRLTNRRPCPLLTPEGDCGVYAVRPMACRIHHATSPASQCQDVAGKHEYIANKAMLVVQVMASKEGVAELVRAVRAELEMPGKSATFAEPISVYTSLNNDTGAYDGGHGTAGLYQHSASSVERARLAGAPSSGGGDRATPPRPHHPGRSDALAEPHTPASTHTSSVALNAARLHGSPPVPRR